MKKIKNFIKKYYQEILCILLPVIIFTIGCLISGNHPVGNKNLSIYDAHYQYPAFFRYFREVLFGNESILYSFKGLLGYNFFASASYYLFNPSNLFIVFFGERHLIEFFNFELTLVL